MRNKALALVLLCAPLAASSPYRAALPTHEVFRIMREECARGWWDPLLVGILERIIRSGANPDATSFPPATFPA